MKAYLQEAENLDHRCQQDKALLTAAGLDWDLVSQLQQRTGAAREAQSLWWEGRHAREDAQKQWDEKAPQAYALRDKMLRYMRYGYRNDAALLKRVAELSDGNGHADMVQDLNDIAILGGKHLDALVAVGANPAWVEQCAALSAEMANLLALVVGERSDINEARLLRDQAYTYLKELVDEIYACGQFVFWDNPARRALYASDYLRSSRAASKASAAPAPVDAPAEA